MCFAANNIHHAIHQGYRVENAATTTNHAYTDNSQTKCQPTAATLSHLPPRRVRQQNTPPPPSASSSDRSTRYTPSGWRLEVAGRNAPKKASTYIVPQSHTTDDHCEGKKKKRQLQLMIKKVGRSKDEAGKNAYLSWEPLFTYPGLCLHTE